MPREYKLESFEPEGFFTPRFLVLRDDFGDVFVGESRLFWSEVDPPLEPPLAFPIQRHQHTLSSSQALIMARHVGYPIISPKEWPVHIYIFRLKKQVPFGASVVLEREDIGVYVWGLLFPEKDVRMDIYSAGIEPIIIKIAKLSPGAEFKTWLKPYLSASHEVIKEAAEKKLRELLKDAKDRGWEIDV